MKSRVFFFLCSVIAILVFVSCAPEDVTEPIILTDEVKMAFEEAADEVFQTTATPGLIALISVDGEPEFLVKRGSANLTTGEPINENNAFRIASVTKTFTGTAVLLLVDEGLINLDASIDTYLPEYNIPAGDAITVRMLGNMTSGLYDYSNDQDLWESFTASGNTLAFPPDSLVAIAFRHPSGFAPGTAYEYCNTNTVLLGLLLEKITGKPATQVIKEKVLVPLHLTNTYFAGPFYLTSPYSCGYTLGDDGLLNATNWNPSWGYTAGAMVSNIEDMKKWAPLLANGALLSETMKTERFNFGSHNYGFCVESINYKNDHWIGHPGTIPGYNTQVWYNPAKKITIVVNSNTDDNFPAQTLLIDYIIQLGDL